MIKAMERLILDPDEPRHQGKNRAVTLHHRKFTMKDAESFLPPDELRRRGLRTASGRLAIAEEEQRKALEERERSSAE